MPDRLDPMAGCRQVPMMAPRISCWYGQLALILVDAGGKQLAFDLTELNLDDLRRSITSAYRTLDEDRARENASRVIQVP
jgi:hypothetical protein